VNTLAWYQITIWEYNMLVSQMMQIFQFAFGGLVPGDTLRMIEEATMHEPVMLQESLNAYDECSQISMNL